MLEKTNTELGEIFREDLCVIKFNESRKANYFSAVTIAKRSRRYAEGKLSAKSKSLVHLVTFDRSKIESALAHNLIEELRSGAVQYTLIVNGRVQTNKYGFINALVCMNDAAACSDSRAHCYTTLEDPFAPKSTELAISLVASAKKKPKEVWQLPCRHLEGFIDYSPNPNISPKARLEAAAIRRCVIVCPFLDISKFEPLTPIDESTKYW